MPRQGGTKPGLCRVGPYAGQVLDYPVHVWEALIDSGQIGPVPEASGAEVVEAATQPTPEARSGEELTAEFPMSEVLTASGFGTMEKVRSATDEELLALSGIGPARLKEVRGAQ